MNRTEKSLEVSKVQITVHCSVTRLKLPHLPLEILRLIFLRTVAPGWLMLPDRRYLSSWNVNTRTKLHLINVCRDWYKAGIKLLYEEIVIDSIGQFCALVSTLRVDCSLAAKVNALHLSFPSPGEDFIVFLRIYDSLPDLCPNLSKLVFPEFFLCSRLWPVFPRAYHTVDSVLRHTRYKAYSTRWHTFLAIPSWFSGQ
ncbi:hypothetical protein EV361DRAFT_936741, partial [Lentinula raphanica]